MYPLEISHVPPGLHVPQFGNHWRRHIMIFDIRFSRRHKILKPSYLGEYVLFSSWGLAGPPLVGTGGSKWHLHRGLWGW